MSDLLSDDSLSRSDLLLVRTAVKQRWPVPEELRELLPQRVLDLLKSTDDRTALAAAKVAVALDQSNQREEHKQLDVAAAAKRQHPRSLTQINVGTMDPELIYRLIESRQSQLESE